MSITALHCVLIQVAHSEAFALCLRLRNLLPDFPNHTTDKIAQAIVLRHLLISRSQRLHRFGRSPQRNQQAGLEFFIVALW